MCDVGLFDWGSEVNDIIIPFEGYKIDGVDCKTCRYKCSDAPFCLNHNNSHPDTKCKNLYEKKV